MPELVLEYPYEDAKKVVKTAFEKTRSVKKYHDNGTTILGKTGFSLASYGEQVIVDFHESMDNPDKTRVTVRTKREVSMNITANPQKVESQFLQNLNRLRGKDMSQIQQLAGQILQRHGGTKEISNTSEFTSSGTKVLVVILVVLLVFIMMVSLLF